MITAMAFPEPEQGKRKAATSLLNNEVASTYVRKARTVLAVLPSLARRPPPARRR